MLEYMNEYYGSIISVFSDNLRSTVIRRELQYDTQLKKVGEAVHNKIRDKLTFIDLNRPQANWFRLHSGWVIEHVNEKN